MAQALHQCEFRFHDELRDFLAPARRGGRFVHAFTGTPAVKDPIEALGVPHTEVDLILVDGVPANFHHKLRGGEQVDVHPATERPEWPVAYRLRPRPPPQPRFVTDVHLGRLASYLRLLGFDCLYRNDYGDEELLAIAQAQDRILLSRDTGVLKRASVKHGAFLHATDPRLQLREVCDRFQLDERVAPFTRCARCNGRVEHIDEPSEAPTSVARRDAFSRCSGCGQLYWPGSHLSRLRKRLSEVGVNV